jgi:alpha-D-xyloside xylohydrolase
MPLFVRAGSLVPMGPNLEYAEQPSTGPIELRVYTGVDADFTLYQDDGKTYKYEKGEHLTIVIHWDQAKGRLRIGDRLGQYSGMPSKQLFRVVFVDKNHGIGPEESSRGEVVSYDGRAREVFLAAEKSSEARAASQ